MTLTAIIAIILGLGEVGLIVVAAKGLWSLATRLATIETAVKALPTPEQVEAKIEKELTAHRQLCPGSPFSPSRETTGGHSIPAP